MITYPAMLDVPRELVQHLAQLLAEHRRARGTRRGTRKLTCYYQALLILIWFRKADDIRLLGAGFGLSRATAYRYLHEGITVLAAHHPDLHQALHRVAEQGWAYVILDGKLFTSDSCALMTTGVKGHPIRAWLSGKHRTYGANIQAVIRPDGLPIWTSPATAGHHHDLTCARDHQITAALNWAATELHLPTLADAGYQNAGHGIKTPTKKRHHQPELALPNQTINQLLRSLRAPGERGFAILTSRWKALRHTTISPSRIGDIVAAALHLTHFEYRYLPEPC